MLAHHRGGIEPPDPTLSEVTGSFTTGFLPAPSREHRPASGPIGYSAGEQRNRFARLQQRKLFVRRVGTRVASVLRERIPRYVPKPAGVEPACSRSKYPISSPPAFACAFAHAISMRMIFPPPPKGEVGLKNFQGNVRAGLSSFERMRPVP